MFQKTIIIYTFLLLSLTCHTNAQQDKPNIIYIMADDLGYADLGCFGSKKIKTTYLDQLAKEGIKFTRHYTTGVCAPSRASLITGRHPGHCEIRGNRQHPTGFGQWPLTDTVNTVAMEMRKAGYVTAMIGKWGLGEPMTTGDPSKKGFDYYFGYTDQVLAHNHFPEFLVKAGEVIFLKNEVKYLDSSAWHKGRGSVSTKKEVYSQDQFTKDIFKFVPFCVKKKLPFFLYYTPVIPHINDEAPEGEKVECSMIAPYDKEPWTDDEKRYAASITYLDIEIGKLIELLKSQGIEKNTLIIFTSDNGPYPFERFESTGILRGKKRDLYEGGIRTPFIANWPAKIKPGQVNESPIALWDFMATACEVAGAPAPNTDGFSLVPAFNGKPLNRNYLYFELQEGNTPKQALIMGDYKLIKFVDRENPVKVQYELYNLKKDPAEKKNLAKSKQKLVKQMEDIMKREHTPNTVFPFPGEQK